MSQLKMEGLFKNNLEIEMQSPGFALVFPNEEDLSFLNVET